MHKVSSKPRSRPHNSKSMLKMLWAVDIFGDATSHLSAFKFVHQLKKHNVDIRPVYVLGASGYSIEAKKKSKDYFKSILKKDAAKFFSELGAPADVKLEVVHGHSLRMRANAEKLIEFSKKNKFSAIIVSARSKRKFLELLMGSFADSLVNLAIQPVFVLGAKAKRVNPIKRILLASDLSSNSKVSFKSALKFAHQVGADLDVLFLAEADLDKSQIKIQNELKKLAADAGVSTKFIVESVSEISPNDILKISVKRKSNLIVIGGRRSGYRTHLLGSIPRFVVRMSDQPVLIVPEA